MRYPAAVAPLAERLRQDTNATVRAAAAESLGDLGNADAVPSLLAALGDTDAAERGYAANSLGLLGTAEIAPAMAKRLGEEPSPATQGELFGALYRLGAADALRSLLALLSTAKPDLAVNLLNVLDDVVTRRQPERLAADAPFIREALIELGNRAPSLVSHAAALRAKLS
jgi:HEAT repeat protein